MGLMCLPRELLLEIAAFEDIQFQDRLSLRLVHPLLSGLLAHYALETSRVTLASADASIIGLGKGKDGLDDIHALINDYQLSHLRSSVRVLKIWIPCAPGNGKVFYPRKGESGPYITSLEEELAESEADKAMEGLLKELFPCLPRLRKVELRAWCGRGGRELTKAVLRGLGRAILSREAGEFHLGISLYGFGAEPSTAALLYRIPAMACALEIRGCCRCYGYSTLERVLAKTLICRSSISKLVVWMDLRNKAPYLQDILDSRELRKKQGPLALRDLDVSFNMLSDPQSRIYEPLLEEKHAARLPELQSLRIQGRSWSGSGCDTEEFWVALYKTQVWLKSITTETVGREAPSPFVTYLAAPQLGRKLKILNLQSFQSDDVDESWLKVIGEGFWGSALPNVSEGLEELTLLLYGRRDGSACGGKFICDLDVLHEWSLSYKTLNRRQQISFPNLKTLTTYVVFDRAPKVKYDYFTPGGSTLTTTYADGDGAAEVLKMKDLLAYLGSSCPKLATANLYILPGPPLRVFGRGSPDTANMKRTPEVLEVITRISEEICNPENTGGFRFRPIAELSVEIVECGGFLRTVDTSEYFYSSNRWHKRQVQPCRRLPRQSLDELFPQWIEDDEVSKAALAN